MDNLSLDTVWMLLAAMLVFWMQPGFALCEAGFTRGKKSDIVGGTPEENAAVARDILANKKGPKYDVVMLNAGAAIYIGGKADSLSEGIARAKELVANGAAKKKLDEFIALSNQ